MSTWWMSWGGEGRWTSDEKEETDHPSNLPQTWDTEKKKYHNVLANSSTLSIRYIDLNFKSFFLCADSALGTPPGFHQTFSKPTRRLRQPSPGVMRTVHVCSLMSDADYQGGCSIPTNYECFSLETLRGKALSSIVSPLIANLDENFSFSP